MMVTFWPRVNTVLLLVTLLAVIGLFATRAFGGPLDPPGPPTTGTDGVRGPGTPIDHLPFPISTAGYYYVTRPLTGTTGQPGITISSSNVTVDLGGFTLGGGASPGDGISVGAFRNVTIRNGAVRAWGNGIQALACGDCRVDNVQASSNSITGFKIGAQSDISNCNASLNGGLGIFVDSGTVRNCTITENRDGGVTVESNSFVEGNRVSGNGSTVFLGSLAVEGGLNVIRDNQIVGNTGTDVFIKSGATANVLTGNVYCVGSDLGTGTVVTGNWC